MRYNITTTELAQQTGFAAWLNGSIPASILPAFRGWESPAISDALFDTIEDGDMHDAIVFVQHLHRVRDLCAQVEAEQDRRALPAVDAQQVDNLIGRALEILAIRTAE